MKYRMMKIYLLALALFTASFNSLALDINNSKQALEAYVQIDDGAYRYDHLASIPGQGFTIHLYNLVSQVWRSPEEIDRTLWQHQLVIVEPAVVSSGTAMLFVGDNDNDDPLPDENDIIVQIITQLALGSQTIVGAVYQIPNQPFYFPGDVDRYKEDDLSAYTWDKYLDTGDTTWPVHLPMTKSVVKAMDAMVDIAPSLGAYQIDDFVLTGYSKRGQVTYMTAAVDPRVRAIAPGVIDVLNMVPSLESQYKAYGSFVPELDKMVELGVTDRLRTPEFADLTDIIDPYAYRDRLTMPKLLLNSSGDQFFLPDSARYYYDDLPGEKLIRYAPNTDHSLVNSQTSIYDTLYTLLGWYQTILLDLPRPEINWHVEAGELIANATIAPQMVRVWRASNPTARDFRKVTIGESWVSEIIVPDTNGDYHAALLQPTQGYSAVYIEFVYQGVSGFPMTFSTRVYVTPDTYPFELDDPVIDPKLAYYWDQQLDIAMTTDDGEVSLAQFNSYLPLPVFDSYIDDTQQLDDWLNIGFMNHSGNGFANRNCTATRLNVRNQQLGWYSDVDLGILGQGKVWEFYQFADALEEYGLPVMAGLICNKINRL